MRRSCHRRAQCIGVCDWHQLLARLPVLLDGDGQFIGNSSVANSKEDAVTDRQFQLLLEGARRLDEPYAGQSRFVIFAPVALGIGQVLIEEFSQLVHGRGDVLVPVVEVDMRRAFNREELSVLTGPLNRILAVVQRGCLGASDHQ